MSNTDKLGGRIPLLDPETLDVDQRSLYERALGTVVVLGTKSGYQTNRAIEALKAGDPCEELRDDELLAQRFALTVVTDRWVDDALFAGAQKVSIARAFSTCLP